jgi:cell wall-associated NlpC family hydrolase
VSRPGLRARRHARRALAAALTTTALTAIVGTAIPAAAATPSQLRLSPGSVELNPGAQLTLEASLTTVGGSPVAGASVGVYRRASAGAPWQGIYMLTTDAAGHAAFQGVATATYEYYMSYGGSRTHGASSARSVIAVKPASALAISPSITVAPGTATDVAVSLQGSGVPLTNRLVGLYHRSDPQHLWQGIYLFRTDAWGHAHMTYRPTANGELVATWGGDAGRAPSISPVMSTRMSVFGQQVLAEAARHAGAPYVYGAAGPTTFDCSGFTMYVFGRLGRSLPHNSAAQYAATPRIPASAKAPGDLLFFFTGGSVTHVGIYAGGNSMWASPHSGDVVKLQPIYAAYAVGRVS